MICPPSFTKLSQRLRRFTFSPAFFTAAVAALIRPSGNRMARAEGEDVIAIGSLGGGGLTMRETAPPALLLPQNAALRVTEAADCDFPRLMQRLPCLIRQVLI